MKAEVTISEIYWNKVGVGGFFFRDQAYEALVELVERSTMTGEETLRELNDKTEDMNIDAVEEDFYTLSLEELAEEFDIELEEEEEDEED